MASIGVLAKPGTSWRPAVPGGVVLLTVVCGLFAPVSVAEGRQRSCGTLHGGHVVILRGPVTCKKTRRVLNYAATHFSGNGPASPAGWECFRISGDPRYNGDECIAPPGAESHPRDHIQLRYRL
jgi:hypothetical protein